MTLVEKESQYSRESFKLEKGFEDTLHNQCETSNHSKEAQMLCQQKSDSLPLCMHVFLQ